MREAFVIALVLFFITGVMAFDEDPGLAGNVARPGYANLQLKQDFPIRENKISGFYFENAVVGTPRAMTMQYESHISPVDAQALADDFINNYSLHLKNQSGDFRLASSRLVLDKFYFINLIQTYNGIDIYGSRLGLRSTPGGKVFFAGGEVFGDIEINTEPYYPLQAAEQSAISGLIFDSATDIAEYDKLYILPLIYDDKIEYRLAYLFYVNTVDPVANWRVFIDARDGSIIWREDLIRYETISGNVSGMIQPATPYDAYEQQPFPNLDIFAEGYLEATTDVDGNYSFDVTGPDTVGLDILLQGPYLNVDNMIGSDTWLSEDVNPGDIYNVIWDDDNSTIPERNAFYHGQVVHDYIKTLDPDLDVMDFPMICRVNVSGSCNAYYSRQDRSINFYREGGGCPNIAQIGDVVYHEWGHGLTNISYNAGGFNDPNGAMHEGFSDIIGCLITDQPLVGRGFFGPGTHLRNLDNTNRFPDDWIGESHHDGLILGGAVWHLRVMLEDDRPNYADTLWHFAKYGYASEFQGYFWDVLTVDDDDGDLDNGTPHAYEIFYAFGELHGIGPGVPIEIEHAPIIDSEDSTVIFPVEAEVTSMFGMDQGSVTAYYSTGVGYTPVEMVNTTGDTWYGEIPNQSFGTTVNYYIEVTDNSNLRKYAPEDAPESVYSFYVGFDLVPPTMADAVGPSNTIDIFGPYGSFSFSAWDIHEVDETSGELHYKVNNGSEVSVPMTFDSDSGIFSLTSVDVGDVLQTGDIVYYYFTCQDIALTPNLGRLPEEGFFDFEIAPFEMVGDFEDGLGDWVISGEGWVLNENQGYQSNQSLKTGEMFYPDNANSIVYLSQPVNCSQFNNLWLEFWRKNFIRDGDTCFVVASNSPDGPWNRFDNITGNSPNIWNQHITHLDGMVGPGNEEVYVGLQFISDDSDNYFGVLADRFILHVEAPTDIEPAFASTPHKFSLDQNYPNPFNLRTIISFSIMENSDVTLEIFDVLGRKVRDLVNEKLQTGYHQVTWDGKNDSGELVTSGIYFYRLSYGGKEEIKSMTLIK